MPLQIFVSFLVVGVFFVSVVHGTCSERYSEWVQTSPCSDSCGLCGHTTITRMCLPGCTCTGSVQEKVRCNNKPCSYPQPTCCDSFQVVIMNRTFGCSFGKLAKEYADNSIEHYYERCVEEYTDWILTAPCTDTCGLCGHTTAKRQCLVGCTCSGPLSMTVMCNNNPCPLPRQPCCGSYRREISGCSIDPVALLTESDCGNIYSEWEVIVECNDVCGMCGKQFETRKCLSNCCTGALVQYIDCADEPCEYPRRSCCGSYKIVRQGRTFVCGIRKKSTTPRNFWQEYFLK